MATRPAGSVSNRAVIGFIVLGVIALGCVGIAVSNRESENTKATSEHSSTITQYQVSTVTAQPPPPKPANSGDALDSNAFIATLDMFKVPYSDRDTAVTMAQALCVWYLANDAPFPLGAMQVLKENPSYTPEDAGHFAGAATSIYCPRFSPDGQ